MRICEANTRILRANFRLKTDAMFIEFQLALPRISESPYRGESNSMQGASVKKALRQRRVGRAFLTVVQRKLRSRISAQNGMHFPDGLLAESSSRNPRSERDTLSQWRSKRKVHPGIPPQTGTRFPLHLLNSKTCAPSIPKLGRRKPKRNRRRSI